MKNNITLRVASAADAEILLEIYSYYVENTAISFEYTAPSVEEFANRIKSTLRRYPYIAAVKDGEPIGYAYLSCFKDRRAYDWSAETSIYIRKGSEKNGVGACLYKAIERLAREQGILNLNACIAKPKVSDEYLDGGSIAFHRAMGYREVGAFTNSGYKFGRWYDMIWMEKLIGDHNAEVKPFIPFSKLNQNALRLLLNE